MAPVSSTVAAWALGLRLRERRDQAGLNGGEAAKEIGIASAYLSDVEHGKKTVSERRLDTILAVYEFDKDEAAELHALRKDAARRGWWTKYSVLFSPELLRMFGYEYGAERVDAYDNVLINGLLQTKDYARAIIEAGAPNMRLAEVERRVECRMTRQQRITGDDPAHLNVVMSEAALWQQVGGPDVLNAQLEHLLTLLDRYRENLKVRIVPFEASGHEAMGGCSFHLLTFPSGRLPALLWQESVTSTGLITDAMVVREFSLAHAEASRSALDQEESIRLIRKAAGSA